MDILVSYNGEAHKLDHGDLSTSFGTTGPKDVGGCKVVGFVLDGFVDEQIATGKLVADHMVVDCERGSFGGSGIILVKKYGDKVRIEGKLDKQVFLKMNTGGKGNVSSSPN
jgi:hypothetical protein